MSRTATNKQCETAVLLILMSLLRSVHRNVWFAAALLFGGACSRARPYQFSVCTHCSRKTSRGSGALRPPPPKKSTNICDCLYLPSEVSASCWIFTGCCSRLISCLGRSDLRGKRVLENRPGVAEWSGTSGTLLPQLWRQWKWFAPFYSSACKIL